MRSAIVTQEDVDLVDWHDETYLYCIFQDFEVCSSEIDSIFKGCTFSNLDWYAGLFIGCRFVKDNMDSNCHFNGSIAYGSTFRSNEGCDLSIS